MNKSKKRFQKRRKTRKNKSINQRGGMNLDMILYTLMMLGLIFPISGTIFGKLDKNIAQEIENQKIENIAKIMLPEINKNKQLRFTGMNEFFTQKAPVISVFSQVATQALSRNSKDINKELSELQDMMRSKDIIYFTKKDFLDNFKIKSYSFPDRVPSIGNGNDVETLVVKNVDSAIYWGIHKDALEILLKYSLKPIVNQEILDYLLENN
jgi:hypothetical protein